MRRIEHTLLPLVLRQVVSRACPSTVPRSGREGEAINCFNTKVVKNGESDLVLLEIVGNEVKGLRHDGSRYSIEVSIPVAQIDPAAVHVTHFYGLDRVEYEGVWSAALGLWIGWPYAWLHARRLWNSFAQRLFNRRSLPARRRLDLLRDVFEASSGGANPVDALDLMTSRHGSRWAGHPCWQSHHEEMESQLELLADAGDLKKLGTGYRPTGQGLRTLEETEEADRRHKEHFRLQFGLGLLALASLLMAAAQAGVVRFPLLLDLAPASAISSTASTLSTCGCRNSTSASPSVLSANSSSTTASPAAVSSAAKPTRAHSQ